MSSNSATRTDAAARIDADEVALIVKAHLRRIVMLGRGEFAVQPNLEPDEPLTLAHFLSGREFIVEIRAFEVTGHGDA